MARRATLTPVFLLCALPITACGQAAPVEEAVAAPVDDGRWSTDAKKMQPAYRLTDNDKREREMDMMLDEHMPEKRR